jgi:hypothetical protein
MLMMLLRNDVGRGNGVRDILCLIRERGCIVVSNVDRCVIITKLLDGSLRCGVEKAYASVFEFPASARAPFLP